MFTYRVSLGLYLIDYYTDEHMEYAPDVYTFVGESVWQARLQARLFLLRKLETSTIVDFYNISVNVCCEADKAWHALGQWTLRYNASYRWDWEEEARFLAQHQAYREGDQTLLALEKDYYQIQKDDTIQRETIAEALDVFVGEYQAEIATYAIEVGLLYLSVGKLEEAFLHLTMHVSPNLRNFVYGVAMRLSFFGTKPNYAYMQLFDELYPEGRPFLGS